MFIEKIPFIGEIMSLGTAVVWAYAVILFKKSGETVHPIGLNLFKNLLAVILLIPTLIIIGQDLYRDIPAIDYAYIFISGILGIGLADTFFFHCLNKLGAGLTAIVDCLYSPFVIFFSYLLLDETLTLIQFGGLFLIISAVLTATYEKQENGLTKRNIIIGLAYGVIAMLLTGLGIVLVKPVLNHEPLLWVTELRLLGGVVVLLLILLFNPKRKAVLKSVYKGGIRLSTVGGSFMGAYVAMILWLGGMKYTQTSIAAALNQTSNIFIFIFAYFILKEKLNIQRSIGIGLAVIGAFLVTFG